VDHVRDAVVQGVQVLAEVVGEQEILRDDVQHVLLVLGGAQVGVQEVMADLVRGSLQIVRPVGADGLNDVGADGLQQHDRLRLLHGWDQGRRLG